MGSGWLWGQLVVIGQERWRRSCKQSELYEQRPPGLGLRGWLSPVCLPTHCC